MTPGGTVSTFAYGVGSPQGLAFDAAGNLYTAGSLYAASGTLSKISTTVTVPFAVGGTAVAGTDYTAFTSRTLTFPAGQTTETITGKLLDKGGRVR